MLNQQQVKEASQAILEATRTGHPIDTLPASCRPETMEEAYQIQDKVFDSFGGSAQGWFVAATNVEMQRQLGLTDAYAARWGKQRFLSCGTNLKTHPVFPVALEAEVSFRIGRDLPPISGEYTLNDVASAVACVYPSVEVVISCFDDWMKQSPLNLIAEGGPSQYLVCGNGIVDMAALDLSNCPVSIFVNDEIRAQGSTANVMCNPLNVMVWLANHASRRGYGLHAGQLCNTGMCASPCPVQPGDRVMVDFGSLGRVQLSLVSGVSL